MEREDGEAFVVQCSALPGPCWDSGLTIRWQFSLVGNFLLSAALFWNKGKSTTLRSRSQKFELIFVYKPYSTALVEVQIFAFLSKSAWSLQSFWKLLPWMPAFLNVTSSAPAAEAVRGLPGVKPEHVFTAQVPFWVAHQVSVANAGALWSVACCVVADRGRSESSLWVEIKTD